MGKSVSKFETLISKFFLKKYGLMVNSGSSALVLAFKVMNLKPGSEVITPCLNFGTAADYAGHCNLRFDDTNPSKEDIEYVNSIKDDVNWLGFNWDGEVKFSSSYFDMYLLYHLCC